MARHACVKFLKLAMRGCQDDVNFTLKPLFKGNHFRKPVNKGLQKLNALPQAPLMPTGGVSLDNVAEWIKHGCIAVGVGGQLTAGAKTGDYAKVTETAKEFIKRIKEARGL